MTRSFSVFFALALVFTVSAQAAEKKCIFGDELSDLETNKRFVLKKNVIDTFKLSRLKGDKRLVMVAVDTLFDKKTRNYYHINRTFMDSYDGGNTIGWVEDVTGATKEGDTEDKGKIASEISDSGFWPCHVTE